MKAPRWEPQLLRRRACCAGCGSREIRKAATRRDGLEIWTCGRCKLGFVDPCPSPEQLERYYGSGYFRGERDFFQGEDYCQVRDRSVADRSVTGYAEIAERFPLKGRRILDVGCGSGALLACLRPHRPGRLVGLDTAPAPVAFGRSRYGLDLRCLSLEKAGFADGEFDLILMVDFLEHVASLPGLLRELARILERGGQLFVLTPNFWAMGKSGAAWIGFSKSFEHLQYFSPESLEILFGAVGLRMVAWWTAGLPVAMRPYPRQWPAGLHRICFPWVSLPNFFRRVRFGSLHVGSCVGHDLFAVLTKP